jgi:polysaccharide chain length determinant protein (PEP-CTERM system associated)
VTVDRRSYTPEALLRIVWRRRWQIVLPAVVSAAAAVLWIHQLPDRYRADTMLLVVPQRVPETFVRSTVATTRVDERLQTITQQILSRTQLEQIVRDFDLYADRRGTAPMQDVVDAMRARDIEIQPVKGDAFRLGFIADRPDVAMRVVDRLASLFIGQTSHDRATIAEGTDRFLEAQLEDARRKLIDNEAKLEDYRRRHNGELPKQLDANVQSLHNTEMQLQVLADSLNRDRDRQLVLERSLKDASAAELIESHAPAYIRTASAEGAAPTAADELARAERTLADMQSTLTPQHPDMVSMRQTVAALQKRAEAQQLRESDSHDADAAASLRRSRIEEVRAELATLEQQMAQKTEETERLRGVLAGYQRRIDVEPTREAELASLTRDYDTLQESYRGLLAKKQESGMAASLERQQIGAQFKVLDPVRLPERPFTPNRARLYPLCVVGGLAIGLAFAALLERLDRGLRTEEDVRAALGLPVLAMVPFVRMPDDQRQAS